MNIQRTLLLFLRHSWLIVLLLALALAAAWIWIEKQTPVYASRSVIKVEADEMTLVRKIDDVKDTAVRGLDQLNTVVGALTSNTNLLAVAKATGRIDEAAAKNPDGKLKPGQETEIARRLLGQLKISLRRNTRLIEIVAEEIDPEKARALAAAVVDEFLKTQKQELDKLAAGGGESLVKQAAELEMKLKDSQQVKRDRTLYETILTRANETNVVSRLPKNPYTWTEHPLVNLKPVRPQRLKTLFIAGFLACAAGVGLILLGREV